jgi:hypothetical protein
MSNHPELDPLLNDVVAESSPADFRAALLADTLRQARRRRGWRAARQATGILGVLLVAAWFAGHNWPEKVSTVRPRAPVPAESYRLVETRLLPPAAIVATADFAGIQAISTEATVAQIPTSGDGLRFVNDQQLLALAGPGAAILVRIGPDSEELVFGGMLDASGSW